MKKKHSIFTGLSLYLSVQQLLLIGGSQEVFNWMCRWGNVELVLSCVWFVCCVHFDEVVLIRARWLGWAGIDERLCFVSMDSSKRLGSFLLLWFDSPTSAALCRHAGIILENDVAIVVKVEQRQRWKNVGDAARSRDFGVTADSVHDTLDSGVIRWIQLLIIIERYKQIH